MIINTIYSAHTILPGLVVFILFTLSQFSEEPFEACIVPHSNVDKAELRKAVVKGPEFTLGSV